MNDQVSQNPLAKHFRQPAIYLKLPSQGAYWPEDALELGISNEIPVYPMTTKDEIILRTPDAVLNGEGVVKVIQSCCPNIKNAWKIPQGDVDAILIAIRIASYGAELDVDTTCPHCKHEETIGIDLNYLLDRIRFPNYNDSIKQKDLTIKLRPQDYELSNKNNLLAFEEEKLLQNLLDSTIDELEKARAFNQRLQNIININTDLIADITEYIELDDGQRVVRKDFIQEFYNNADAKLVESVKQKFEELRTAAEVPQMTTACQNCNKNYDVNVEFDYSRFFDKS